MRSDDAVKTETEAQWLEHSEVWRYAHLDLAPSEAFRRMAIQEHERLLHAADVPYQPAGQGWLLRLPRRGRRS